MWRFIWLLILSGAWPPSAGQQSSERPGLTAYVHQVLQRNRALEGARLRVQAASGRIGPAGALPDPMLGTGIMSLPVTSFAAQDMTQLPLMVEQSFPGPGKRGAATAVARADSGAVAAELAAVTNRLAAEAGEAWFTLAYARRALEVWTARAILADRAILAARVRYETGVAPQTDLLRARLRRAEVAEEEQRLRAEVLEALAQADALRGGGGDSITTELSPAGGGMRTAEEPAPSLVEGNPDLLMAVAEIGRSRSLAAASAIASRPDFMVRIENGIRFGGREPVVTARAGISVPLWNGRKQRPLAEAAALEVDASEARYDDLRARVRGLLRAQLAELAALLERIVLVRDQIVPLAEAAAASALQRYQVGAVEFSAVLETQDDAYRAQLGLARLLADHGAASVRLAALVGEEWYR